MLERKKEGREAEEENKSCLQFSLSHSVLTAALWVDAIISPTLQIKNLRYRHSNISRILESEHKFTSHCPKQDSPSVSSPLPVSTDSRRVPLDVGEGGPGSQGQGRKITGCRAWYKSHLQPIYIWASLVLSFLNCKIHINGAHLPPSRIIVRIKEVKYVKLKFQCFAHATRSIWDTYV